ncbi:hypothetical protein IHQ68_15135 [Chelatococcus sambhunathii]|uniref:Uncharacterized protein n=1 Tax=Chelatococcus sambhunathii TaxID=363953 RepID=A0ABU1DIZ2_9HYPH|nr:hypothetical protein [Chelatococcus sambhunathii]MDR4307954.1 hypothetical protein [Chelatococcus sambhunathii]
MRFSLSEIKQMRAEVYLPAHLWSSKTRAVMSEAGSADRMEEALRAELNAGPTFSTSQSRLRRLLDLRKRWLSELDGEENPS